MSRNDLTFFNNFDLLDPFFDDDFFRGCRKNDHREVLKTDVIENEKDYELIMDAPGAKKENINIELEDGYLTISVLVNKVDEEKKSSYIRKERSSYQAKRSFYVGYIKEEDVKAKFENGELHLIIPKEQEKLVTKKSIAIE